MHRCERIVLLSCDDSLGVVLYHPHFHKPLSTKRKMETLLFFLPGLLISIILILCFLIVLSFFLITSKERDKIKTISNDEAQSKTGGPYIRITSQVQINGNNNVQVGQVRGNVTISISSQAKSSEATQDEEVTFEEMLMDETVSADELAEFIIKQESKVAK